MNTRLWAWIAALAWGLTGSTHGADPSADQDEARSGWKFRRSVTVPTSEKPAGFAAAVLPPELAAVSQPNWRDLRLLDSEGQELPFVVDYQVERDGSRRWEGALVDTQAEKKLRTVWIVDLGGVRSFDRVDLKIDGYDFAKRFRLETSDDQTTWHLAVADVGIFDREWNFRVHHTTIPLKEPQTARYLRLTADDQQSAPISLHGVTVTVARPLHGQRWDRRVEVAELSRANGLSTYQLPNLPFDRVEIDSDDAAFSRRVSVVETREVNGHQLRVPLGEGIVYRLKTDLTTENSEVRGLAVKVSSGGRLAIQIQDGDSPPLRNLQITVSGVNARLLFPVTNKTSAPMTLYYGNSATRAPIYDLEGLKGRLALQSTFVVAELGIQSANLRYRPVPPLQFVSTAGATLETSQWKMARRLSLPGGEDIYSVKLAAADLAVARDDFADLRIVNAAGQQVPYILEFDAAESEMELKVERTVRANKFRHDRSGTVSCYRLFAVNSSGRPVVLPLQQLRLEFQETFFSRPASVVVPAHGPRPGDRIVFSGQLSRTADQKGAVVIFLDGGRHEELFLEIEEGDNAPLTLRSVQAAVSVPRVVFKLKPDAEGYRLLLGNPRAQAPRYDIQSLRHELLAYSAVPAQLSGLDRNEGYHRLAADYFQNTPPTLILWGALLVAIVGLLGLTVRLLKKPQG